MLWDWKLLALLAHSTESVATSRTIQAQAKYFTKTSYKENIDDLMAKESKMIFPKLLSWAELKEGLGGNKQKIKKNHRPSQ